MLFLLCVLPLACTGCSFQKKKSYLIGIDPSWFPLELQGREARLFAFSHDLLTEIAHFEKIRVQEVYRSWDNLALGLEEKKYDAILSSIYPHLYEQTKYSFSDLYIHTGPVLVVKKQTELNLSDRLAQKEIALYSKEMQPLLVQIYPQASIRLYPTFPEVVEALVNDIADVAAMGHLLAIFYTKHSYKEKVKIATPPLSEAGLRLITLHEEQNELIETFNRGLAHLKNSGAYDLLLKKWDLNLE